MPKNDNEPNFEVPAGHQPEEFLNDAQLVEFYQRKVDSASDKDRAAAAQKLRAAKVAAAITAAAEG